MIAELQEPIPGRLMGWIHSRYASSNCDRCSSWEVPWNTYHIQQLNPLHWPVVSNIFYFTLSLWGLNVKGKIVFADKTQLYACCCILILAKLLRDLEFLSVGFFFVCCHCQPYPLPQMIAMKSMKTCWRTRNWNMNTQNSMQESLACKYGVNRHWRTLTDALTSLLSDI